MVKNRNIYTGDIVGQLSRYPKKLHDYPPYA